MPPPGVDVQDVLHSSTNSPYVAEITFICMNIPVSIHIRLHPQGPGTWLSHGQLLVIREGVKQTDISELTTFTKCWISSKRLHKTQSNFQELLKTSFSLIITNHPFSYWRNIEIVDMKLAPNIRFSNLLPDLCTC